MRKKNILFAGQWGMTLWVIDKACGQVAGYWPSSFFYMD